MRMDDLIERGVAMKAVRCAWLATEALEKIPAVDVIEVVRCEECNFFSMYALTGNGFCVHEDGLQNPYPKDFCSHAERRVTNGLK